LSRHLLRSLDGRLHAVPNGEIRVVAGITRNWSRAMLDLGLAHEEDLDRVLAVLEQEAEASAQEPEVAEPLIEAPTVIGPLSLGDWAVTVRTMVRTLPGKHWDVGRVLRRRLLAACAREQITLPYPRQEVMVRDVPVDASSSSRARMPAVSASLRPWCRCRRGRS
jgi:small-conductance mechanosensitive channel